MIPRRVSSHAETEIILASAIKAAQDAGGLRVGMVVGHPSIDEAAHLVALDEQEATLAWPDGTTRTFPAGEVFDANRAYRIAVELAHGRLALSHRRVRPRRARWRVSTR